MTTPKEQLLQTLERLNGYTRTYSLPCGFSQWRRDDGLLVTVWEKTDAQIAGDFAQVNALVSLEAEAAVLRQALDSVLAVECVLTNDGTGNDAYEPCPGCYRKNGEATKALVKTTAGQSLLDELQQLRERVTALEALGRRSAEILSFHAGRCPLNPMQNYSGSESHLAEYRRVIGDWEKVLPKSGEEASTNG